MKDTKIKIWRVKNSVSFQIMDSKDIDSILDKGDLFTSSDGFIIRSGGKMGINKNSITLPRLKSEIYKCGSGSFESDEVSIEISDKIKKSLIEWKESGFKISPSKPRSIFDQFDNDDNWGYGGFMDGYDPRFEEFMDRKYHEFRRDNPNCSGRDLDNYMNDMEYEYYNRYGRLRGDRRRGF